MFTARSLTFILGPILSKKSWLALDLGVCVASGIGWQGNRLPQTPTLHIDEAHGRSETSRRLSAVMGYHNTARDIPFRYSSFPGYVLTDPNDIAAITQQALSFNAGFVVIDQPFGLELPTSSASRGERASSFPFSNASVFSRRNGSPAPLLPCISPLVSSLRSIAESTNATILVLLQTQTRSQRTSLAKALTALGADQVLGLDFYPTGDPKATPYTKYLPRLRSGYLHLRTLASAISPLGSIPQVASFLRSLVNYQFKIYTSEALFSLTPVSQIPNRHALHLSTYQAHLGRAGSAVLHFLDAKGLASSRDLMSGVTAAVPSRVRTVVHQLAREGYIVCTKRGGAHHPAIYALTPMGRSVL
jgi:hypothetical protein